MVTLFLFLFSLIAHTESQAASWEVGVIFLGTHESEGYQKDIDQNILELARLQPNDQFRLKLFRELPTRSVSYTPQLGSKILTPWDSLFHQVPLLGVLVPGQYQVIQREGSGTDSIIHSTVKMREFLNELYVDTSAKRVLILYGHGMAFNGLKSISLKDLRERLEESIPVRADGRKPLDLLWLDACFMASVEVGYEFRNIANLMIASEDAEFSAGAPFEGLKILEQGPDDLLAVAKQWAESFIESYSVLEEGSQRRAVYKSSATISVIRLDRIQQLVKNIKEVTMSFGGSLDPHLRKLLKTSQEKRRTDYAESVDLGSFFQTLGRKKGISEVAKEKIDEVLSLIEFNSLPRIKTSPRVSIEGGQPKDLLVFSYDDWTLGFEDDRFTLGKLPRELTPQGFLPGPNGKSWPYCEISKIRVYSSNSFSPFSVGHKRFSYFLVEPITKKMIGGFNTIERTQDYFIAPGAAGDNPILFTGYTQGVGTHAERYSGLGILDPSLGATSIGYLKTDFAEATGWGGF